MFLITKVDFRFELRLFLGKLKPLQARRIKKKMKGGYQLIKNFDHYGCLTKENFQLKPSTMARSSFKIRRERSCKFPL